MVLLSTLLSLAGLAAAHPARGPASSPQWKNRAAALSSYRFGAASTYTSFDVLPAKDSQRIRRERDGAVDYVDIATRTLREAIPSAAFRLIDDAYVGTNGVAHVHFQQTVDGVDVDDASFNVNILENGTVLSFGNSFAKQDLHRRNYGDIERDPLVAFKNAVELLNLPISDASSATAEPTDEAGLFVIRGTKGSSLDPKAKLAYVRHEETVLLVWRLETNIDDNQLLVYVDADTGTSVSGVYDSVKTASYEVYPWGSGNPTEVDRKLVVNPETTASSPFGWHSDGTQSFTTLRGNNAFITYPGGSTPANSPSLVFSYPYSPVASGQRYTEASAAQGFYTVNKFHDILYALGFNEPAGNFQTNNNGKGGAAGDPLNLTIQTMTGTAFITIPADGTSPRIQMSIWSGSLARDSVFDTTVLLHEYMHGVTARLVGGPGSGRCLSNMDGLSIDEGFSDLVPTILRVKAGDTRSKDYTIADWVTGQPVGLRSHYISTSLATTPLTFESLNRLVVSGGFDLATVWASAFYDIFWNLADAHGIGDVDSVVLDAAGVPRGARYLLLKLILDSEALMPCNANHLQARDALLEAERVLTAGANRCAIWKGFARRGFGQDATVGSGTQGRVNGFAVPSGC
ncbi:extracellular elastinolytic metalloproteinase [Verticillium alfalfae VaMs.102]|uniref:Extracellular metalloproteinase n=1 Tax=Verticillium alfalfae (strain VaMs.102 / ATCC MYA-4576 / FGSC 10136) TaxID=526221 RepID=C9SF92_VERA1|nr:extracellular elastinolytic metalloproteinase [Verticillium alfalfae VaMs.102]EEY17878.1 extracellular elastinolytic metalloproteinase [Verticillium alfalfae VaMs.102]